MAEGTAALAAAMAKVQAQLPKLERDRTVAVETKKGDDYSYSYVTLANLTEAILPLLAQNGLSFVSMPGSGADGKMCLRYHLLHESGESLTGEFPISGEGGIQMIGGRITYARRYCLAAIVGVAADEDDESHLSGDGAPRTAQRAPARARPAATQEPEEVKPTAQRAAQRPRGARPPLPGEDVDGPVGTDQHRHMRALWNDIGYGSDEKREQRLTVTARILGLSDLNSSADMTRGQADAVIAALKERKAAMSDGGDA